MFQVGDLNDRQVTVDKDMTEMVEIEHIQPVIGMEMVAATTIAVVNRDRFVHSLVDLRGRGDAVPPPGIWGNLQSHVLATAPPPLRDGWRPSIRHDFGSAIVTGHFYLVNTLVII